MRSEYEQRLRDLESERLTAEHDKAKARAPHTWCPQCVMQPQVFRLCLGEGKQIS